MGYAKPSFESLSRAGRTAYFMAIMLGSLMVSSTTWVMCLSDILIPCALLSTFTCCTSCFSFRIDWSNFGFRSSLVDIPFLSLVRSLAAICAYGVCDIPSLCHGPYLATTIVCGIVSGVFLIAKACVFSIPNSWQSPNASYIRHERLTNAWGLPLMFLSSMALALGHVFVAYRARHQARRRLLFYGADEEAVLIYKLGIGAHAFQRPSHASPRFLKKLSKSGSKVMKHVDNDLPASMLADADSLFMKCKGLLVHYKLFNQGPRLALVQDSSPKTGLMFDYQIPFEATASKTSLYPSNQRPSTYVHSDGLEINSLHAPLLDTPSVDRGSHSDSFRRPATSVDLIGWPAIASSILGHKFGDGQISGAEAPSRSPKPGRVEAKFGHEPSSDDHGVVFIHGFGGGVFSWRHVMGPLAKQTGYTVAGFDRPGWGLTSRPSREDWEKKGLPNPYELHSQVDLILAFCQELGLRSVVLVGHDDGGMLALMTAAKASQTRDRCQVDVKGVVLVGVSLSREVVPGFARVLLHTSLGRQMLQPLLRSEIGQVATRRAWHDSSKLTSEVLDLYKVPLRVEGWDRALAEVTKSAASGALSSSNVKELLRLVGDLPALLIAGLQDRLVPLKAAQTLASQLSESKIVAIPGCGHLPPEECPGALLSAVLPFISNLFNATMSVHSSFNQESLLPKMCG